MADQGNYTEESIVRLRLRQAMAYVTLIVLTFICLFPFYILIVNSTRAHPEIQKGFSVLVGGSFVNNIRNVLSNDNLPVVRGVLNSLFISSMSALFSTYFSALTAFGIHAYDFRFKKTIFSFILMIMMVPVQVTTLGFIQLMNSFNLMDTYFPLIVPTIAAPAVFFFMKQYMESILPVAIVEAARIDGSNEFYTFNKIVLPLVKPAMAVQGIFAFVTAWNNFFLPALIIESKEKKTLPILISQLRSADFLRFDMGQVYILITIAIVPVAIVYLILSKFIIQGIAMGSVKG
jgi:multiple sugar transport system permease protein